MQQNSGSIAFPAENLPILDRADVVVVGGGSSGFIAATAAARAGAEVILIEKLGYVGGCTTAPYNTSLGVFVDSDGKQIIKGLGWEFLERMEKDGQAVLGANCKNQLWPPYTRKVALDMLLEAKAKLRFYTWTYDVVKEGDSIKGVVTLDKGGRGVIVADAFVDATGDADIAAFAGSPFEMTDVENLQQISCDYIAAGVDSEKVRKWAISHPDKATGAYGLNEAYTAASQGMLAFTIPSGQTYRDAQGKSYHMGVMPTVKLCIHRDFVRIQGNSDVNPLDPAELTGAEVNGLYRALAHLQYMKDHVDGFENAYIAYHAHLGVRETRRIVGDYFITIDDLHGNVRFPDVIAKNCRNLDFHLRGTQFVISSLKGHHDIPLRALLPQKVDNLLVCGRSISSDHEAQASLRGAATCFATGHAAGVAAAVASSLSGGKIRKAPDEAIQKTLREQGAILE